MSRTAASFVRRVSASWMLAGFALGAGLAAAPSAASAQSAPRAAPSDVESLDAIVAALYDVISGPAGQPRDWDRFRSLFRDGARLIPTGGASELDVISPDDYVARSGPFLEERGFFETEIHRTTERYGAVAHLFSTYESRWTPEEDPFDRGINSIQAFHDGSRWWIVTIFWQGERGSGDEIPANYLPGRATVGREGRG